VSWDWGRTAVGMERLVPGSGVLPLRSRLINGLANVYLHNSSHVLLLPRGAESWGKPVDMAVLPSPC